MVRWRTRPTAILAARMPILTRWKGRRGLRRSATGHHAPGAGIRWRSNCFRRRSIAASNASARQHTSGARSADRAPAPNVARSSILTTIRRSDVRGNAGGKRSVRTIRSPRSAAVETLGAATFGLWPTVATSPRSCVAPIGVVGADAGSSETRVAAPPPQRQPQFTESENTRIRL